MPIRETLKERADTAKSAYLDQVHTYVGANDYLYERYRSQVADLGDIRHKVDQLQQGGTDQLRATLARYQPSTIRNTVQAQIEDARNRQQELCARGEEVLHDWRTAAVVTDAQTLIDAVRTSDETKGAARIVRAWLVDYPTTKVAGQRPARSAKPTARPDSKATAPKAAATKPAATKPAANKSTATKTVGTRSAPARKATSTRGAN